MYKYCINDVEINKKVLDILRKGGYQAVKDGRGHVIMLNPKKDIKIEGVADNSNVAVNVGTHMQHERKLVEAERLAPLDQAMYSTRRGFTDYTVEPPIEYKKLDLNVKGLPIIDEAKEAHKNSLISILNQGDLTRKETAGVIEKLRSLGVPNLAKGGSFILKKGKIDMENVKLQEGGFAMQQAAVQGNSSTDNLRNASVTEEQKKKDIKQKAIKDATGGKKDTNVDVAKLNNPEDLLDKYKDTQRLFAQEGVVPVSEKVDTLFDEMKDVKKPKLTEEQKERIRELDAEVTGREGKLLSEKNALEKLEFILGTDLKEYPTGVITALRDIVPNTKKGILSLLSPDRPEPSDYFKNDMMGQWLYAEGEGDKDGQKTNQAYKGIHVGTYPQFQNEIEQGILTDDQVTTIMHRQYTGRNTADGSYDKFRDLSQLEDVSPEAAKLLFMDAGYTGQNAEAIRDLQRYLGVEDDGLLGEDTLGAMQGFNAEAYRNHLGTLDRYKDSPVYNRFFTEEERIERGLYNRNTTKTTEEKVSDLDKEMSRRLATDDPFKDMSGTPSGYGLNYAEGGLTENDDDTLGATEKEVADDIPAQISEGELVVPANVVRYHGLSTYESLRQSALLGLKGLEDEGQLKKVDENGIPVEEDKEEDKNNNDVKVQTVKMLTAKDGAFPDVSGDGKITRKDVLLARGVDLKDGGFPDISGDGKVTRKDILMGRGVNLQEGGVVDTKEDRLGENIRIPEDNFPMPIIPDDRLRPGRGSPRVTYDKDDPTKGTLTTPEGKDYRLTNPNLKITAEGPRTQNIVGGDYTGDPNLPGFGVDKGTGGGDKKDLGDKIIDELTPYAKAGLTIAGLDLLFNQGKITSQAFNWARENIFTGEIFNLDNWQMFKDGKLAIRYTGPSGGAGAAAGTLTETAKNIAAGKSITSQISIIGEGANAKYVFNGVEYSSMDEALSAGEALKESLAASDTVTTGADAVTTGSQGVWNWKTGLAAVGAGLSLYDIIENGPSVANVSGLGYSTGVLAQGGVFGSSAAAATATGTTLSTAITVLGFVALAAGLVQMFSGPPSNKVGEAAYNFDNPEYNADDILSGGFWTKKRSDENINGARDIVATIGSYVNSLEESLEINIGGELFIDVGNREGLRYGYVEGYDELGMYKYHKKDLDYQLLHGPGQVGKGFKGEDSVTQLMDKVNDDINVLTMFALADKAAGGEGYATFDKIGEYRDKIHVLSTYKPAMAGSNNKAVLTEQERNILQGFQQKEFAKVTGEELAVVLTLYDKIKPVHNQNQYQNFSGYGG
jgi:hypothetical protein